MRTAGIDIGSITAKAAIVEDGGILGTKIIFTGYNAEAAGVKVYQDCFSNPVWIHHPLLKSFPPATAVIR